MPTAFVQVLPSSVVDDYAGGRRADPYRPGDERRGMDRKNVFADASFAERDFLPAFGNIVCAVETGVCAREKAVFVVLGERQNLHLFRDAPERASVRRRPSVSLVTAFAVVVGGFRRQASCCLCGRFPGALRTSFYRGVSDWTFGLAGLVLQERPRHAAVGER